MGKQILGVVGGLMAWFAGVLAAGVLLRLFWPEYVAASGDMSFTLPMKLTRLSIGALTTFAAGAMTGLIGRSSWTPVVTGALLLLLFIPQHISLWDKFPIWYHLTFLMSLVPLAVIGGRVARSQSHAVATHQPR
ncbi:MAG TPA: hypothetical protein VGH34_10015 [Vicinamibacterales bacterium]